MSHSRNILQCQYLWRSRYKPLLITCHYSQSTSIISRTNPGVHMYKDYRQVAPLLARLARTKPASYCIRIVQYRYTRSETNAFDRETVATVRCARYFCRMNNEGHSSRVCYFNAHRLFENCLTKRSVRAL